jgi:surfactin synthase thioesterase subunit
MMADWFIPYRRIRDPEHHILYMPPAGGGANFIRGIEQFVPATAQVEGLSLPGRQSRFQEEPIDDMDHLISALLPEVEKRSKRPYVLVGQSMGAWVAFALAQKISDLGYAMPKALVVVASRPPHCRFPEPYIHRKSDREIWAWVNHLAQFDPAPSLSEELFKLLSRPFRADFRLIELWRPIRLKPLDCSLSVLGGDQDPAVDPGSLKDWSLYTTRIFHLEVHPGGHFFISRALPQLGRHLTNLLLERHAAASR